MSDTIKQIIPCSGWSALYRLKLTGEEVRYPVACWALVIENLPTNEHKDFERTQFEWVRGMIPLQESDRLIFPDEEGASDEEFVGYEQDG